MENRHETNNTLIDALKKVVNFSELENIIKQYPDDKNTILEFLSHKDNFFNLVKDPKQLQSLIKSFYGNKQFFDLICEPEIFNSLIINTNHVNFLLVNFRGYSDQLYAIVSKPENLQRLLSTPLSLKFMQRMFPDMPIFHDNSTIEDVINDAKSREERMSLSSDMVNPILSDSKQSFFPKKEDSHVIKLVSYLNDISPDISEVIITIGSAEDKNGANQDDVWQQNIMFDPNNNRLILNIDPDFKPAEMNQGCKDTENRKYLGMGFNVDIAQTINPIIANLLRNNVTVVFCDFRSPHLYEDVYTIFARNAEYYRDPTRKEGNLILLQGYFGFYPVFWPTKGYLENEQSKFPGTFHHALYISSAYSQALLNLRKESGGNSADIIKYFESNPIFSSAKFLGEEHNFGIIFSYPLNGELKKVAENYINEIYSNKSTSTKKSI